MTLWHWENNFLYHLEQLPRVEFSEEGDDNQGFLSWANECQLRDQDDKIVGYGSVKASNVYN